MKSNLELLVGALIGGTIGATAALLLTPYSGKDLRKHMTKGFGTPSDDKQPPLPKIRKKPSKKTLHRVKQEA